MVRALGVPVPQLEAPPRFDPVYVTDEDLDDLATFFNMPESACLERLRMYSPRELADQWRDVDPQTPEEIATFYRTTDLYIWELMQWHTSVARRSFWQTLAQLVEQYPVQRGFHRVLDFGCGIGTDSLYLTRLGYTVTCMDLTGPAFRFAQHRFARRGVAASFMDSNTLPTLRDSSFDIVVCFDVFEHLPDPLATASDLVRTLAPDGVLAQTVLFSNGGNHPCHLHANFRRFGGLRWHIHLAGLGLRQDQNFYRKTSGMWRAIQRARFAGWRATGLWLTWDR